MVSISQLKKFANQFMCTSALLITTLLLSTSCSDHKAQSSDAALTSFTIDSKDYAMTTPFLGHKDIAQIYGKPSSFNRRRTAEELLATCATWQEPAVPDFESEQWYRAATTLHATRYKTVEQHQQMLQLYEAAARRGHYKAVRNLIVLYSSNTPVQGIQSFKPDAYKARYWINYGLKNKWPAALEWVSTAMLEGTAEFKKDENLSLAYLQQASDLGVPLAQYQVALIYGNQYKQVHKEKALLQCAANQGFSPALYDWAAYNKIHANGSKALELYQRSIMGGSKAGGKSAYVLAIGFDIGDDDDQELLGIFNDTIREQAYRELEEALRGGSKTHGNPFLSFPRLNEVLPLPPAQVTEWEGIYSAMSEDDAIYYQNPPPAEFYLKQVEEAGLLIPLEYLVQPTPYN